MIQTQAPTKTSSNITPQSIGATTSRSAAPPTSPAVVSSHQEKKAIVPAWPR